MFLICPSYLRNGHFKGRNARQQSGVEVVK
nr:MAG TPA: hypothetical protein [Caudoviricetes sp.]